LSQIIGERESASVSSLGNELVEMQMRRREGKIRTAGELNIAGNLRT